MEQDLSKENSCEICSEAKSKYCCPKCNVLYCSLQCYKSEKHLQCSESFYKDCILSEISSTEPDNESKRQMLRILNRINENDTGDIYNSGSNNEDDEETSDDENCPDLTERLCSLDLNNADLVWEHLTNDERQEFESLLSSGDVEKFVPEWKAWWEHKDKPKLVEVQGENKEKICEIYPKIKNGIQPIEVLSCNNPSEFVKYNIINMLGAYALTVRYFNGEHQDSCLQAVNCLANLSANLLNNKNFNTAIDALTSIQEECVKKGIIDCDSYTFLKLNQDVKNILKGPGGADEKLFIKSALSDIHKLLSKHAKELKLTTKHKDENINFTNKFCKNYINSQIISRSDIKLYIKKIEYYLSYISSTKEIIII